MANHGRTLAAIFAEPTRANTDWADIEALFVHLGATVEASRGSRVRVTLDGVDKVFHRPHPGSEAHKPHVREVRAFLTNTGHEP